MQYGRRARWGVAALCGGAVLLLGLAVWRDARQPSTDAATLEADVVHVAAEVGGRIVELPVTENQAVEAGALLFAIDPLPYRLRLEQAQAELEFAQAALDTQRRLLATQRAAAQVARAQTGRAAANLQLAERTVERLQPLTGRGYVPTQQLDQAQTARHDAATSLRQAEEQQAAAEQLVDTDAAALANVRVRQAAVALAQRALDDTRVRAGHAGRIVGLAVASGEHVLPGQALFTLVVTDEWFAVANFREFELGAIRPGDCATVHSMIDRRQPIHGVVQGIGAGVLDTERVNLPRSLPFVERSLNWVRVAQRFPVRIRLEAPPAQLVRLGASAVVGIGHGAACR